MGGKTTTTQTATMDPIQEQFITDDIIPFARDIRDTPFKQYTGDRVAELTPIQRNALGGYGALTLPSEIGEATDIYRGIATRTPEQRQARLSEIQEQMAPMLNRRFAQQGVGREAQAIKANAFGDRTALYEGERQAELDARAFDLANKQLAQEDALAMRSAGALSGSGIQGLKAQQNILGSQMTAGDTERQLQQQQLDADFNQYLAEMQYPLTQFGVLTGAGQAFPAGIGTTTGVERDPMGGFGRVLSGLGSFGMGGGFKMFGY